MPTLTAARAQARRDFDSNRNLRVGSEELQKSLVFADEVAKFLRENVVQGQSKDGTNYSVLKHVQHSNIQLTQSQI
jgi:complex III assembly factor LYRM7